MKARYRSDRFFHVANVGWHYETSEGVRGPFASRADAMIACRLELRFLAPVRDGRKEAA